MVICHHKCKKNINKSDIKATSPNRLPKRDEHGLVLKRTEQNLQTSLTILACHRSFTRLQSVITFLSSIPWVHILLNTTFASKQKVTKCFKKYWDLSTQKQRTDERTHKQTWPCEWFEGFSLNKPSLMGSYRTFPESYRMPSSHRLPVSHDEPQSLMLKMTCWLRGWGGTTPNLLGFFFFGYQLPNVSFLFKNISVFSMFWDIEKELVAEVDFPWMVPSLSIFGWIMMTWQHMLLRNMALFQFFTCIRNKICAGIPVN